MKKSFEDYDRENPQIYDAFKRFALELLSAGRRRAGAKLIMERIRWETMTRSNEPAFKVNNNYTADYARKLMAEDARFHAFFATRLPAGFWNEL